jgi:uncharacterized membrane protein
MAGVGWKLERILERNSLGSTLQAYLTGVAVTSAPWLLTTAVLVTLRLMTRGHTAQGFGHVENLITIAYAVTLVLSAPVHVVVSRFAADRVYEKRLDLVGAPLRSALTLTLLGFLVIGIATMAILQPPIVLAVPGAMLTSIIAAQWLLLAVGGGMSSPAGVLAAFAIGSAISILAALGLALGAGLGPSGYLAGFTFGQAVALTGMLIQILRSLPADESPVPRGALREAFHEYRLLALSAFAVHAAIWVDKVATLALRGSAAASTLASVAALAWFALIPAFAWIYIQTETSFYRVFHRYYRGIEEGASLHELETRAAAIHSEAGRLIRGALSVQATVTAFALLAAPHVVVALGLSAASTLALRLSLLAASCQVLTLLCLLLLYYLDLRREAFLVALAQLGAVGLATVVVLLAGGPAALGAALGSAVPARECAGPRYLPGAAVRRGRPLSRASRYYLPLQRSRPRVTFQVRATDREAPRARAPHRDRLPRGVRREPRRGGRDPRRRRGQRARRPRAARRGRHPRARRARCVSARRRHAGADRAGHELARARAAGPSVGRRLGLRSSRRGRPQ